MIQIMEKILVIDDDRDLCELLDEYLTREGFRVETVHDGEKGIEKVLTGTYGVVVLNEVLPSTHDGYDVLKQMLARMNTPVLMLTARGDDVDRIVGLQMEVDDYFSKPFNPRELVARLCAIFRRLNREAGRVSAGTTSVRHWVGDVNELRSPLARLNVALELCRKGSEAEIRKSLGRIERESGRLNDMIGHLLTLNRVESGISVLEKKRIDLAKMVREIADDADFEAKSLNRGVKITAIEACFIEGDEDLLRRAIENVARNAVRYTRDGSTVEVSLRCIRNRSDSMGLITIRDHGKGVPEAFLPHLFQPFYRVGDSRERETGGTGLGLAITAAAVRFHGGTVTAANSSEGGVDHRNVAAYLSAVTESASKESSNR